MASKILPFALVLSAGWSCSPVANPIVEASGGGLRADAAGGGGGNATIDDSGMPIDGDAATELRPPW